MAMGFTPARGIAPAGAEGLVAGTLKIYPAAPGSTS